MFTDKFTEIPGTLVDQATQAAGQAMQSTQKIAHNALDSVRDTSHYLRVKAEHASENTVSYIKQEPVKAMLIAAATGAALMALVSLISHSRSRH